MRLSFIFLAMYMQAQDTTPRVTAEDRAAILQLDRDRLAANIQANQIVAKAQQDGAKIISDAERAENDAITKLEQRLGCKIDLKTADCTPAVKK